MLKYTKNKILIIGYGSIGKKHFKNIKKLLPKSDIAVLRTTQKLKVDKNIKFYFKLKDAIKFNPSKVIICTSANKHWFYFKKFKNLKCSFFIEKPLVTKISDLKYFKDYKKKIFVGYFLRIHPGILYLKKLLKAKLHKVRHVNFEVGYNLKKWRDKRDYKSTVSARKKLGGGALFELSHELDLATWLFDYPTEVLCIKNKISNLKINTDDLSIIYLNSPRKKLSITIHLDMIQNHYTRKVKIILDDENICFDFKKNLIEHFRNNKIKKVKFFTNFNTLLKEYLNLFLLYPKGKKINYKVSDLNSSIKLSKLFDYLKKLNNKKKILKVKL